VARVAVRVLALICISRVQIYGFGLVLRVGWGLAMDMGWVVVYDLGFRF